MVGNITQRIIILLFLFISVEAFADRVLRASGSDNLNLQTGGNNTRFHIDSSGNIFFDLLTANRVPYIGASGQIFVSAVTDTELGFLSGVTSGLQSQLDGKLTNTLTSANVFVGNGSNVATGVAVTGDIAIDNAGVTAISTGVIVDGDINATANITATKLGTGAVDNTELNRLDGLAGDILTTTSTSVVTNKDYDGGTASNTSRLTLPSDTTANLNLLTRKEGTIVYSTDDDTIYIDDGAALNQVTGAGGAGDVENIPSNPGFDDEVDPFTHTIGSGSSVGTGGHLQMTTKDSPYIVLETGTTHDHKWCFTPTASTGNLERNYEVGCFVKSTLSDISLCYNDGTNDDACNDSYDGSDKWKYIFQRGASATGEQVCMHITSASTSDIQVDSCRLGEPKFSTAELNNTQSVEYYEGNGQGSTNTGIRRFLNNEPNGTKGSGVFTATDSATDGFSLTMLVDACGSISYADVETGGAGTNYGLGINSSDLTSSWDAIPYASRLSGASVTGGTTGGHGNFKTTTWSGCLTAGDIIRPHAVSADDSSTFGITRFSAQFTARESNVIVATDNSAPSRAYGAANTAMNQATVYFLGFSGEQDANDNIKNVGSGHSTVHTNATYYEVPDSGYYDIHGAVYSADADLDSGEQINLRVYKGGSSILAAQTTKIETSLGAPNYSWSVTTLGQYLEKGELLNLGFSHAAVGQVSVETNNELGYFEVKPSGAKAILAGLDLSEYSQTPNQSTSGTQVFVSALVTDGASTTTVSEEDDDFLNGNCTNPAAGSYTCTFTSNYWKTGTTPHCWVSPIPGGPREISVSRNGVTNTTINFEQSGSAADSDFHLFCKGVK